MAATANFGWTKPTVNADSGTWGTILNVLFDAIDAALKVVSDIATGARDGTLGTTSNAVTAGAVDCSLGSAFHTTVAGAVTFAFSSPPASGKRYGFLLELTYTSGTNTWPSSVKWPNDTAPTLDTGKTHLLSFTTRDGGTRWRGAVLPNYVT